MKHSYAQLVELHSQAVNRAQVADVLRGKVGLHACQAIAEYDKAKLSVAFEVQRLLMQITEDAMESARLLAREMDVLRPPVVEVLRYERPGRDRA